MNSVRPTRWCSATAIPWGTVGMVRHRRGGFSLLELMLVLGILVAVAAISYPAVGRSLDNNRLRYSGDQIRAAWARARNKSMESGRTYVFRSETGSSSYMIEPWSQQDDLLETDLVTQGGVVVGESVEDLSAVQLGPRPEVLPEGITFVSTQTDEDLRAQLAAATASATANSAGAADAAWSSPIFFYPDGTCSSAQVVLANSRERYVVVTIRGMTGVVATRGLLTAEELAR